MNHENPNAFSDPNRPVYRHSIFKLGPTALTIALFAVVFPLVALTFIWGKPSTVGPVLAAGLWVLFVVFILLGPVIHYYRPSPFEKARQRLADYGGTATFSMGNYPARLLIYLDGVEIRAMYSAYFIPFEMMEEPKKGGFLRPGILIQSNLPEVPNRLRFFSFSNSQEILEKIFSLRASRIGADPGN